MVRSLIPSGAAPDESAVYLLARVTADQPLVEVRVTDACLTVEESGVFAGIVRALVSSLITDARHKLGTAPAPTGVVDAHLDTVAHGEVRRRRPATTRSATTGEHQRLRPLSCRSHSSRDAPGRVNTRGSRTRLEPGHCSR